MFLLVGLGNPGSEYERTRHNVGWQFLDFLHDLPENEFETWKEKKKLNSYISEGFLNKKKIVLAKPTTFMNLSGLSVQKLIAHYSLSTVDLIVIHDDIDIYFGEYKIQTNRGAAGHHGVESIIGQLKTKDFMRVRIGIKPNAEPPAHMAKAGELVLKRFSALEEFQLPVLFQNIFQKLFKIV